MYVCICIHAYICVCVCMYMHIYIHKVHLGFSITLYEKPKQILANPIYNVYSVEIDNF